MKRRLREPFRVGGRDLQAGTILWPTTGAPGRLDYLVTPVRDVPVTHAAVSLSPTGTAGFLVPVTLLEPLDDDTEKRNAARMRWTRAAPGSQGSTFTRPPPVPSEARPANVAPRK